MTENTDPRDTPRHPRRRTLLVGHLEAEEKLLHAYRIGRLHHAWLLTGPRGVGKATLAYRFARFLFRNPDPSLVSGSAKLDNDPTDVVYARVAAGGHPDLLAIERAYDPRSNRIKSEIAVDVAREATLFFSRTAGEGGFRICIVDPVDDLNPEAANSLLKVLEEPPQRSLFLLLANAPGGILATLRSRSIRLDLRPLAEEQVVAVLRSLLAADLPPAADLTLAASLSRGSPGRALELLQSSATRVFSTFRHLVSNLPHIDQRQVLSFADQLHARTGVEDFHVFCELIEDWVADRAREFVQQGRPGAEKWASVHGELDHSIRRANALNLDRRQLVLHAFQAISDAAR